MTKFITNQNIEIKLELAGLGDRIVAFFIDGAIILAYLLLISFVVSGFGSDVATYIAILPVMFYSLLFEVFANGQSPGKKYRNIRVVRLDGGAPGIYNYLLRWILRPIDIILYGSVAMFCIIVTKNGQRLGDLAAGTTVIKMRSTYILADVENPKKINNQEHVLQFPQVKRLNDKQVEIIRKSLKMRRDGLEGHAADDVADKIKAFFNIEADLPTVKFLYTILRDYEYIHSR